MWLSYISLSCCFKTYNIPNGDCFSKIISRNNAEQTHHLSPEKVTPWKQSSNPLMRCCWTLCLSWRMSTQEPQDFRVCGYPISLLFQWTREHPGPFTLLSPAQLGNIASQSEHHFMLLLASNLLIKLLLSNLFWLQYPQEPDQGTLIPYYSILLKKNFNKKSGLGFAAHATCGEPGLYSEHSHQVAHNLLQVQLQVTDTLFRSPWHMHSHAHAYTKTHN